MLFIYLYHCDLHSDLCKSDLYFGQAVENFKLSLNLSITD